jgi:hypothetical protein
MSLTLIRATEYQRKSGRRDLRALRAQGRAYPREMGKESAAAVSSADVQAQLWMVPLVAELLYSANDYFWLGRAAGALRPARPGTCG